MKITCEVRGHLAVRKKLESLTELKKAGLVVKKHMSIIQSVATQLTPVDTGNLKKSWRDSYKEDGFGIEGVVGNIAEYAGYVEKGTRFMEAQPYLEPAVKNDREEYYKDLKRALKG